VRWIERQWSKRNLLTLALAPLSAAFLVAVKVRQKLYRSGVLSSTKLAVPVIVVGNISVGGTGKTPLVLWITELLLGKGYHPGIVSRGYGGSGTVQAVTNHSTASEVGDEPALLARRSHVPIFVGPDRVDAARALLTANPRCNVIISDDGLQHYALQRDVEIAVVDARSGFGNGLLLPAGPLREPVSRLRSVDAVVWNGSAETENSANAYFMSLGGDRLANVATSAQSLPVSEFRGKIVHALAAIGNPQRFFDHLRRHGLDLNEHAFPDHYAFRPEDIAFAGDDVVLMTEKDAVKCVAFAKPNWWYLPVSAQVDSALGELILAKLRFSSPSNGR